MSKLMAYLGYHATIDFDAEDRIFVGTVFGISDSIGFHGRTVDELEEMFHQSIDNYLEMCKAFGKAPEKEFKGSFNVRIKPELHRNIALKATELDMTLNQYVVTALEDSLKEKHTETVFCIPAEFRGVRWAGQSMSHFSSAYQKSGLREIDIDNKVVRYGVH